MERTRREAAASLLAAAAAGLWPTWTRAAPGAPAPPGPQDRPTQVDGGRDPFERLTAPVMLNGRGPFAFMVDTGANISCVERGLAAALALPIALARPVHTVVGVTPRPMALIDELQVGGRTARGVSALAVPIDSPQIQGVLAVDWLKDQRLTLDFASNSLEFAASRRERSGPGRVVVPARRRLGQLTIVDADLGASRVSAMIDSGSELSLCNAALLGLLDRTAATPARRERVDMVTIVGEAFIGEMVYLPFLRIGGLQLGNVPVAHADTHVFQIWGLEQAPAVLLGMDLLRQFRAVSLDFGRSQVRFDLPAA